MRKGDQMATKKADFLNTTYSGYFHSVVQKEDEDLTRVGPGTPAGEYFRRFWHPIALAADIEDMPVAIRILGEDLVLFRDKKGRLGLLELHCPHRGTSLEYGVIEEEGVRCCYHGWLIARDGKILETPAEPPDSTYKDRFCQGAYPTHEFSGMIFAYMGPPEKTPPFPMLDTFKVPGTRLIPAGGYLAPCNWLQNYENVMDPVHTTFLHARSSGVQFSTGFLEIPTIDFVDTPLGMAYVAARRVGDNIWLRMTDAILPNMTQINRNEEDGQTEHPFWPGATTEWFVPVDDTHSVTFSFNRIPEDAPEPPRRWGELVDWDEPYEKRQRYPSDGSAIVSQRPIAVHAMEHLADTDRGVIKLRRATRERIQAVQRGEDPVPVAGKDGILQTYTNDTVRRVPRAATPEDERRLLQATGLKWAQEYVKDHPPFVGTAPYVERKNPRAPTTPKGAYYDFLKTA